MACATILEPKINLAQATRALKGPVRELSRGRLAMVLDFYIPYRIFEVTLNCADEVARKVLAIDAVTGHLDPYAFEAWPVKGQRRLISSDRVCATAISEARALELAEEKTRREVYVKGFFRIKAPQINGSYVETIHIPYWVGVYRRSDRANIDVLNGIIGTYEGAKIREIVANWFETSGARLSGSRSSCQEVHL
jgi:hypothetical protein